MHISEGVLSAPVLMAGAALTAPGSVRSCYSYDVAAGLLRPIRAAVPPISNIVVLLDEARAAKVREWAHVAL